jgi:chromosome partitioning protein
MRIAVANLKGGTGKTTTAVHLALGLARSGRTLLVDSDPQASAFGWSEDAGGFPITVVPWACRDLARRVEQVAGDYAHVVIDTPPQHEHIVRQALLVSDRLVLPLAPSALEVARLGPTFGLAADVELERPLATTVLLSRVRAGTRSRREARALLLERGVPTFETEVRLREAYAAAYGEVVQDLGEYEGVLVELEAEDRSE